MDRQLLKYPGINAEGEDNQHLYMMRNHGGIHHLHELEDFIKYAAQSYYEGSPRVPDEAFNVATELLKLNDPNNKLLTTPGWGYQPPVDKVEWFGKFPHDPPMASITLDQRYTLAQVMEHGLLPGPFIAMPKYNGGSGRAYYRNGELQHLLTRGDGNVGLDVKENFILGATVPLRVKDPTIRWVEGEFIITETDWSDIVKPHFNDTNLNARDAAIRLSEGEHNDLIVERCLKFIAYDSSEKGFAYGHDLDELAKQGFTITSYRRCENWKDFTDLARNAVECDQFFGDFDADGLIVRNKSAPYAIKF